MNELLVPFEDQFTLHLQGVNYSISNLKDIYAVQDEILLKLNEEEQPVLNRVRRRYKVYERQKPAEPPEGACPQTGGVSAFTFLNFLMGTISIAASVINNVITFHYEL